MPAKSNHNGFLLKGKNGGFDAGLVLRSTTEVRFLHLAMVFEFTPWRLASVLKLS